MEKGLQFVFDLDAAITIVIKRDRNWLMAFSSCAHSMENAGISITEKSLPQNQELIKTRKHDSLNLNPRKKGRKKQIR
jgi:hypothetical protein